jgi:hypothetical protein
MTGSKRCGEPVLGGDEMGSAPKRQEPLHVILMKIRIHEHGVGRFSQTVFMDAESSSA